MSVNKKLSVAMTAAAAAAREKRKAANDAMMQTVSPAAANRQPEHKYNEVDELARQLQSQATIDESKKQQAVSSSATPALKFTPQSVTLTYRSDTIDKSALEAQINALGGTPSTAGRAKVAAPPPQRTAEEIKAHLDRKFKAIQAAYKAAAPKTDEELKAEIMTVIRRVEQNTMSIPDVKAYTKRADLARYLRKDKFTDAMLATRIQKRVDEDDSDED